MKTGERWSSWKAIIGSVLLLHTAGCVTDRAAVEKNLMAQPSAESAAAVAQYYRVGCPDIIALEIAERPEFTGHYEIGVDGRINLGDYGNPRIEGRMLAEAAQTISAEIGVSPSDVHVSVVEFRSQHVLLFGEVAGQQRSVPYRGQETVLELLQRVGGITPGAAPDDVYVVRPHLGDNRRPENFRVDLNAIVMRHDHRSNIRILPFDQVYVGETRESRVEKAIPPWLRWIIHPGIRNQESGVRNQESGVESQESAIRPVPVTPDS
jgi:polysaccharide biosynthesis/export protein